MPKLTQELAIEKAKQIHGENRYIYDKSIYLGYKFKLEIICPIENHGSFWQMACHHLQGRGCPKCSVLNRPIYSNEYIDAFIEKHKLHIKRIGDYINNKTSFLVRCLKCNNEWKTLIATLKNGKGCLKCLEHGRKLSNAELDVYMIVNEIPLRRIGDYIKSIIPIPFECLRCGNIWNISPSHAKRDRSCPKCSTTAIWTNERLDRYLEENCFSIFRIEDYKGSNKSILFGCEICKFQWKCTPSNIKTGHGCPKCTSYVNEKIILRVLDSLKIEYMFQYKIKLPIGKNDKRIDFFLPKNNCLLNIMVDNITKLYYIKLQ